MFILLDICRYDVIGAWGLQQVHTPIIDYLAVEGVRFDKRKTPQTL